MPLITRLTDSTKKLLIEHAFLVEVLRAAAVVIFIPGD